MSGERRRVWSIIKLQMSTGQRVVREFLPGPRTQDTWGAVVTGISVCGYYSVTDSGCCQGSYLFNLLCVAVRKHLESDLVASKASFLPCAARSLDTRGVGRTGNMHDTHCVASESEIKAFVSMSKPVR